jgi:hypothetical protein
MWKLKFSLSALNRRVYLSISGKINSSLVVVLTSPTRYFFMWPQITKGMVLTFASHLFAILLNYVSISSIGKKSSNWSKLGKPFSTMTLFMDSQNFKKVGSTNLTISSSLDQKLFSKTFLQRSFPTSLLPH